MVAIDASRRPLEEQVKVNNEVKTEVPKVEQTEEKPVNILDPEKNEVNENVLAQNSVFAAQPAVKEIEPGDISATAGKISASEGETNIKAQFLSFLLKRDKKAQNPEQEKSGIDYLKELLKKYFEMKKFDFNGDGKIDDAEKAAYDAYKEMKKFDINKDGKIDDFERAAMEAYKNAKAGKNENNTQNPILNSQNNNNNSIQLSGMGINLTANFDKNKDVDKPLIDEAA